MSRATRNPYFSAAQTWAEAAPRLQEILQDLKRIAENSSPQITYVTLEVTGGTYGINVMTGKAEKPAGVIVVNVQKKPDPSGTNTGSVSIDWEWRENSTVRIRNIAGLTTAQKYNVTLGVLYGG